MSDGQLFMALFAGWVFALWGGLALLEAWLDVRRIRRDPVIRDLRSRAHDNAGAALDGHPGVSAPHLKERL